VKALAARGRPLPKLSRHAAAREKRRSCLIEGPAAALAAHAHSRREALGEVRLKLSEKGDVSPLKRPGLTGPFSTFPLMIVSISAKALASLMGPKAAFTQSGEAMATAADAVVGETAKTSGSMREPHVFAALFQAEWPKLRNYLRRFVGAEEAEDIAQEAFSRLYAFSGEVRAPSRALYTTARNLVIDGKRKAKTHNLVLVASDNIDAVADPRPSQEEETYWREELKFATRLLERMPARRRKIFLMQVMEGCSYAEIASRMRVTVVVVKKELLKAFEACAAHGAEELSAALPKGRRRGLVHKRKPP
jgi:RNA polymerase sigma factor (sigma-70 family)